MSGLEKPVFKPPVPPLFEVPLEPYTIMRLEHASFIRAKHEEGLACEEIAKLLGWPGTAHDAKWVKGALDHYLAHGSEFETVAVSPEASKAS